MNKEQYLKRQAAWNFFHEWERERQYREYSEMSYDKRSEIGQMLFEWMLQSNPEFLKKNRDSEFDFQHKCQMAQLKARLRKYSVAYG
ncbi:hypothetical protein F9K33_12130 [bacterium]|nr:MAG: hypothetical protein F9K33_12130 [bacterium]MBL7959672.1 hypothetical protein [bacterium]